MAKLNDRCFCYFTAAMLVFLRKAPTWRLHTKLCKFGWNTPPNTSRMKTSRDLNLGDVVYISIIFHIPASWLNLLNGYDFYFWWRDTTTKLSKVVIGKVLMSRLCNPQRSRKNVKWLLVATGLFIIHCVLRPRPLSALGHGNSALKMWSKQCKIRDFWNIDI